MGHPEHDLLFVAAQVAKAAGITDPKYAIRDYLHRVAMVRNKPGMQIKELLVGNVGNSPTITEDEARAVIHYPRWRDVLEVYQKMIDPNGAVPHCPTSSVLQVNSWMASESWLYRMLLKGQGQPGIPLSLVREKLTRLPVDQNGRALRITTILFSEPEVYKMLMRGHAPQSEPFRKWVFEEVLPTIRKTGQYNAAESSVYEMLTRVYWAWRGYKLVIGL